MAEEAFSESLYADLDISEEIKRAVADMGFVKLTPIQEQAIPALLTGRDVIGQAQTGTGKTAAFGLPILQMVDPNVKSLQAVVLCPTRELAVQATNEIRNFAKYMHNVKTLSVYGGQDISVQIRGLKGVQIIVGTPGRVMDHMRRHTIKMDTVKLVVLDEADEMLKMGFREDMEVILGAIEQEHQTCLFSATMPDEILRITGQFQNDPLYIKITKKELTIDRIEQYYYPVKQEYKTLALCRLIRFYNYNRSIIFCNTKGMVDELAAYLTNEGYAAAGLHGDLTQKQRDSVMGRFRSGSLSILIATDIAARGIDVDNVEAVFNYDIPLETEHYVHRIGRTGRSGKEGTSHTLCRSKDFRKIREIEAVCHTKMEEKKIPGAGEIKKARELKVLNNILEIYNEQRAKAEAAAKEAAEQNAAEGYVDTTAPSTAIDKMIKVLRVFCEKNDITLEKFAAAALLKELDGITSNDGEEEPEINLADKPKSDRRSRGSRFSGSDMLEYSEGGRRGGRNRRDGSDEGRGRGDRRGRGEGTDGRRGRGDGNDAGRNGRGDRKGRGDSEREERRGFKRDRDGEKTKRHSDNREERRSKSFGDSEGRSRRGDKDTSRLSNEARKSLKEKNREQSRRELKKAVKDVRLDGSSYNKDKRRKIMDK
ncbi:MAG: DEAD/DEAH box helicase [Lachnospiraceae bacterium]|nr:DEAD/DEAH box helicase [Lachnospiraceae bacterium]